MSTRIYTGCEIVGHTLESFLKAAQRLHPQAKIVAQRAAREFIMRSAVHQFDEHHLGLAEDTRPNSFIGDAFNNLLERQDKIERTGRRDGGADFAMDITLFPLSTTRAAPARLLAVSFIENPELRKFWTAQPFWRDFWYGDSGDAPEDVPRKSWAERKRLWARVFPDGRPPSQRGYSVNILRPGDIFQTLDDEALAPHMPDLVARAHFLVDFFTKEPPEEVTASLGGPLNAASRAEKREAIQQYLLPRLVPEVSMDQLRGRLT
jgi:hypothetical protein